MKKKATLIIISLTILSLILKLDFEYYNFVLPLLLSVALAYLIKKGQITAKYRLSFGLLIIINLFCILTSDEFVYKLLNNDIYYWSERELQLSDFQGIPDSKSEVSATVFPRIIGKLNKVYNYPPAIVFASNESHKSWIKASLFDTTEQQQIALSRLLRHEKLHLSITEIFTRMAQDSLNKMIFSSSIEKYKLIEYYYNQSDSIQDVFDDQTNHGTNLQKNKEWEFRVQSSLNSSIVLKNGIN